MKKFLKFLILPLSILMFMSCGSKKEELNIYTWTYFIPDEIITGFEKESGIKVNLSYYDNNDTMVSKLLTGANPYDIISPSTDFVDVLVKKGLLLKLDKEKLSKTFENLDYQNLKLLEYSKGYDEGLNYSIPYVFFATGITVNVKELKNNFKKDLDIFLDERLKGHMTMLDDGREVLGMTLQYLGYNSNSKNDKELNEAKELILKFKKNIAKFENNTFGKGLATGEFLVSHGYLDVFYEIPEEREKDYLYFLPTGAMMYIDSMAILKDGPNRENAYKFLEYLYRPENYKYVFEMYRQNSVVKGVEENSSVKAIISAEEIVKKAKLPFSLDDEAKEKQDKIWNEIKLAK